MMHLPMLVATILTIAFQYKCLAYTVTDGINEDYSVSLSSQNNFNKLMERSNQPESRLIPIITFNPFNKHQNQNSLAVNAATQQQLDQLNKDLQALQNAYKKVKPVYPDIVKFYKNLKALNAKLKAQGITISKVVANANKIKASLPVCPKNVIGGQVSGGICFTVNTATQSFADALMSCQTNGGTLAQPAPVSALSKSFYETLKSKFPTQFATVETATTRSGTFWIGYREADGILIGQRGPLIAQDKSGKSVMTGNSIFFPLFDDDDDSLQAAAIHNSGVNWEGIKSGTALSSICQYTLVV